VKASTSNYFQTFLKMRYTFVVMQITKDSEECTGRRLVGIIIIIIFIVII